LDRTRRLSIEVVSSSAAAMARLARMPVTKVPAVAISAPNTAMATAPPTCRNVLKTALAVPPCSAGTPRSYIATAARAGQNILDALVQAAAGTPWIPGTT
jgi:hypothetical protein